MFSKVNEFQEFTFNAFNSNNMSLKVRISILWVYTPVSSSQVQNKVEGASWDH